MPRGLDPPAGGCYLYGRSYSPTVQQLSRQLAAMENTEAAYAVSSGETQQQAIESLKGLELQRLDPIITTL